MIFRREKRRNFTTVANEVVDDVRLSYEALGLLTYLLSRPDDWEVNIDQLRTRAKIGRHKIYKIAKELQGAGYLSHKRVYVDGKVDHGYWVVREEPEEQNSTGVPDSDLHPENRDEDLNPDFLKEENLKEENRDSYKRLTGTKIEREALRFRPIVDEEKREAAFQELLSVYPPEGIDDVEAARKAWADVSEEDWPKAPESVPRFVRERKRARRSIIIGLTKFIRDEHWKRFPPPTDAGGKPVDDRVTIRPYSRDAWALFARAYSGRKSVANAISWVRNGAEIQASAAPGEDETGALVPVEVGSMAHIRWQEHCRRLGFVLPMPDAAKWIYLPTNEPPHISMNWKGYTLIEPVRITIREREWWWRLYRPKAPIKSMIEDRSVGTVTLYTGPLPLPSEIDAMVKIEIGTPELEDWEMWFSRHGVDLFRMQLPIWAPTRKPPALHEPIEAPDYETLPQIMGEAAE